MSRSDILLRSSSLQLIETGICKPLERLCLTLLLALSSRACTPLLCPLVVFFSPTRFQFCYSDEISKSHFRHWGQHKSRADEVHAYVTACHMFDVSDLLSERALGNGENHFGGYIFNCVRRTVLRCCWACPRLKCVHDKKNQPTCCHWWFSCQ